MAPTYNISQKEWIERMKDLSDASLAELITNMQQVLQQWKVGQKGDFELRLALARDEQSRRVKQAATKKENPGKPGS